MLHVTCGRGSIYVYMGKFEQMAHKEVDCEEMCLINISVCMR